jgi:co-chaperonin GroES (HSP10)
VTDRYDHRPKIGTTDDTETTTYTGKIASQLPKPTGYHILCAVPEIEQKFDDSAINEETLTTVLFVVDLGPDCYLDKAKFPSGPWCSKGDFIITRPYAGSRLVIHGRDYRLINDDTVEGVVENPIGIRRK